MPSNIHDWVLRDTERWQKGNYKHYFKGDPMKAFEFGRKPSLSATQKVVGIAAFGVVALGVLGALSRFRSRSNASKEADE